jgi:hypothetical protein
LVYIFIKIVWNNEITSVSSSYAKVASL